MFIGFPPDQFGDYTSFLEIAFALNVLFNAWHAIPINLAERWTRFGKYAEKPGAEAYDKVRNFSKAVVRWGQRSGVVLAPLIVAALYGLPDEALVTNTGAIAISLSAAPLPLTFLLVQAARGGFLLWLLARNVAGFLERYRSETFKLRRHVRQSEKLRARWLRERQSRQGREEGEE